MPYSTREEWLVAGVELMRKKLFEPIEQNLPPIIRPSVGLCGGKGIGLAIDVDCSEDGSNHIFVDPQLADPVQVLSTLLHELCHASVGNECGHKGPFVELIHKLGLEGKPTAAGAVRDTELWATLTGFALELGDYPHSKVVRKKKDPKPSKWCAFISRHDEEYVIRANKETVENKGRPVDPWGDKMLYKNPEDQPEGAA